MRTAFIKTIIDCAKKDTSIYLLNGDLGFSVLEPFTELFPDRSINMGVSEANMVSVAAGLASTGKKVFIYSIIPFVTARVFEQIRNDVAMQKANVVVVGVGSGLSYGSMGATHHAIEDLALMRVIPNMKVVAPGDPYEVVEATRALVNQQGPAYLRLNAKGDEVVHHQPPKFILGKALWLKKGGEVSIITTGNMLPLAARIAKQLQHEEIATSLLSMHTLKPLDVQSIEKVMKHTKLIVTLEEHSRIGGLGGAVSEVLSDLSVQHTLPSIMRFGLPDDFTHVAGSQAYLREKHGLSQKTLVKKIKKQYLHILKRGKK